jgi:competence protein ComEC
VYTRVTARHLAATLLVLAAPVAAGHDLSVASAAGPPPPAGAAVPPAACGAGRTLRVHFYDVAQGLAALVDLPDGRHVLVDTGDRAHRAGCGEVCETSERHLLERLRADLGGAPIDVLWITHPHSDHIGAAADVLDAFPVGLYVDNGRDAHKAEVARAHRAARAHGVAIEVVDPAHAGWPAAHPLDAAGATLTPIVPPSWPSSCAHDANECSIALRVDFCASSMLLTGDAEHAEEAALEGLAPVTLLQVAHHGSATSTTPGFLAKTRPRYAVISVGRPGEGLNAEYCLPRALIVQRLTRVLGGAGIKTLQAFDGERCDAARPPDWIAVPTSDRLWATERDGDVVLTTRGDGTFERQ